jgi:hypothetical protein
MEEKVYLGYRDMFGQPSTQADLETILKRLNRSTMLRLLSGISFSLDFLIGKSSEAAQIAAIKAFFPEPSASQMVASNAAVFHRHQLLFLMQEVIKHCLPVSPPKMRRFDHQIWARCF